MPDIDQNELSFVEFPINASENVLRYMYPKCKDFHTYHLEYDEFLQMLKGNEVSLRAKRILHYLFDEHTTPKHYCYPGNSDDYLVSYTWRMFPYDNFEILSDNVSKVEMIRSAASPREVPCEFHTGKCKYNDIVFNFKYGIADCNLVDNQHKAFVSIEGEDFINMNSELHVACQTFFMMRDAAIEVKTRKEKEAKERAIWEDFRKTHRQELSEWLSSITAKQITGIMCERMKIAVKYGNVTYYDVVGFDKGFCPGCTMRCSFTVDNYNETGHTEAWYRLGIDKLFEH